jgi:hypothetical protein
VGPLCVADCCEYNAPVFGRCVSFVVLITLLAAASAFAQDAAPQPDEREVKARQLFAVGKYAEALDLYGKLYAETTHPTYLRNIGRCYQNLGEATKAISSFNEYLRQVRDLAPDQRALVEGYVREMEALKRRQDEENARTTTQLPPSPPPVVTTDAPQSSGEDDGGRRIASYVVGGVSLAALGVGGYFGVRAISKNDAADPLCPMDRCSDEGWALHEQATTAARISNVALGVGLVGAGVAAYLFFTSSGGTSKPADAVAGRVRVHPQLGSNVAGLIVGASW